MIATKFPKIAITIPGIQKREETRVFVASVAWVPSEYQDACEHFPKIKALHVYLCLLLHGTLEIDELTWICSGTTTLRKVE